MLAAWECGLTLLSRRVVGFRGLVVDKRAVLSDFMPLGSLEAYLLAEGAAPPPGTPALLRQAASILCDVALGMAHLHAEGFVWRDCAARNVLLCMEDGEDRLRAKCVSLSLPCAGDWLL